MKLPLTLPLDASVPRGFALEKIEIGEFAGRTFLMIEVLDKAEATASGNWLGRQIARWEFGDAVEDAA